MLNITFWFIVLFVLFTIFELLRRKTIQEKYAVIWLIIGLIFLIGALAPNSLNKIATLLGFQVLSNFVLFVLAISNIFLSLQLSLFISKAEEKIQSLAEEVAILRHDLEE